MTGNQIRRAFLDYFGEKGHAEVESSSLIPEDDPTLLFANAGMNQFKELFLGNRKAAYTRAVSCQKCVRAGGKHNDLENVGRTARHHTFFEMLGNFSFGDYFKKEACLFAWEFLTERLGLPVEKLWVTIYLDDDEAAGIWENEVAPDRIVRLGEKDNFWSMGEVGPCGPCSEIMFDQGKELGCGKPDCKVGCDCDRYLEIWNLVFMQYNRDKEGTLNPLPHPSIDTGMGLERITAVKQGVKSNFDCDLFAPLIDRIKELAVNQQPVSLNVIADHIRTAAFLITDGALPGNEGRGYVLRRIIRRAIRHGRMLGITEPFFYRLTETISRQMKEQYPGLEENVNFVSGILQNEEERFASTLERGLRELAGIQAEAEQAGQKEISGSRLFQLYDTFGFPLDLAGEILQDNGFTLDRAGYETAMAEQQKRARSAGKTGGKEAPLQVYQELSKEIPDTDFLGYDQVEGEATVSALIAEGKAVSEITAGQSAEIILDRTPFYAEGGGQASDSGNVYTSDGNFQVDKVDCKINRIFFHTGRVLTGRISVGDKIQAVVNGENRNASAANHTATHLLQAALRMVLGDRIKQAGSSVRAEGLRFDFTHLKPVTDDELSGIQAEVNRKIRENIPVKKETMPLAEAMKIDGLMALFEDKYQRHVRVVRIPGFSAELCGGIHAERTGDIGFFKIRSEEGVAAGIRRIWALTGEKAYGETARESGLLKELGAVLKASAPELPDKVEKLLRQIKDQEKEISRLTDKLFSQEAKQVKPEKIGDHYFLQKSLPDETGMKEMMSFCDEWRNQFSQKYPSDRYLTLVSSLSNGKVNLVCASTIPELPANKCITDLTVPIMGGGGGGRPEMAKAGGGDPAKLPAFVEAVRQKLIDEKG